MSEHSDSETSEGFVPNRVRIDSQISPEQPSEQRRPGDFEARHLSKFGVLSKEPVECYHITSEVPRYASAHCFTQKPVRRKKSKLGQKMTIDELNSVGFHRVYSREHTGDMELNTFRELPLKSIEKYDEDNYKLLRPFEEEGPFLGQRELQFNSKFESGNLAYAFRNLQEADTYYLLLHNDTNTLGYTQWLYFSLQHMQPHKTYKFVILNLRKSHSFFADGLQPVVFSLHDARQKGNGWSRRGENISYGPSLLIDPSKSLKYYSLSFELTVDSPDDYITISSSMPYSYSRLINNLKTFKEEAGRNAVIWDQSSVAYSLANNLVPAISLRAKSNINPNSKSIVILARQHSGETWSSFLMEQILQQLSSCMAVETKQLLSNFIIRVYPMVNVDGVIYGNFRCDLSGSDLNRNWKDPSRIVHPAIYEIKKEIALLHKSNQVVLCLDLHGHSKDYDIFAYSCKDESSECRKLPFIYSKMTQMFNFFSCTFGISKFKTKTARAVISYLTENINTVTIEISAHGFRSSNGIIAFEPKHMRLMAKIIVKGAKGYFQKDKQIESFEREMKTRLPELLKEEAKNKEEEGTGSDSQPEGDEMEFKEKCLRIFPSSLASELSMLDGQSEPRKRRSFRRFRERKTKSSKQSQKTVFKFICPSQEKSKEVLQASEASKQPENTPSIRYSQNYRPNITASIRGAATKSKNESSQITSDTKIQKPLNLVEFSLKKLPFFAFQKIPISILKIERPEPPRLQRELFDRTFATYESMCRPRTKQRPSKKVGGPTQESMLDKIEEDLPYLCILSENKKRLQKDRIREKKEQITSSQQRYPAAKNRKDILIDLREKHLHDSETIAKIWRENFTRNGKDFSANNYLK